MSYCLYVYCIKIGMDPIDGGGDNIKIILILLNNWGRKSKKGRKGVGKNIKLDGT